MSNDQDDVERIRDAPPRGPIEAVEAARAPNTIGWWIAAVVAMGAVAGGVYLLSGVRPSPDKLEAAHDRGVAEAQIDDSAHGAQFAAAKAAQAAAASQTHVTENAARTSAEAAAHDVSITEPAPQPPP